VEAGTARERFGAARVARLATVGADLRPHVVPCCFVLDGDTVYSAVDAKPKTTLALRRLANIEAHPWSSMVADHYEEDWDALWWVRVDGPGRVVGDGPERDHALGLLTAKYEQYRVHPPPGPVVAIGVETWRSWP